MRNYIRYGEVIRELERKKRAEVNRESLNGLSGQIVMFATGVLIGFLIGMAIGIMK